MYSLAPEYSKTRRPEKCSTLIGSGTAAWCLYSGGVVRFIIRFQISSACRSQPFSLADISGVGGLGQNIILCPHNSAITVCYCSKCSYYSQYDYRLYDKLRYYYSMI